MLYWCVNKMNLNESMFSGRNDSLVRLEQSLCTHNVTDKEESLVPPFLQCFSGLLGNILALIILIRSSKRHKWKPFYRLVCALALTDAIVSVFVYPVVLKTYVTNFEYCFTNFECYYVSFLYSFSWFGSALLVTSMSLDRFLAIVFPFYYNQTSKYIRANTLILSSWILCALICMLPVTGIGNVKMFYADTWCFIDFTDTTNTGSIIVTYMYACLGLLVFAVTVVMNVVVIVTMIRRIVANRKSIASQRRLKSDIYIVVFLVLIVVVFSICWVPLTVSWP